MGKGKKKNKQPPVTVSIYLLEGQSIDDLFPESKSKNFADLSQDVTKHHKFGTLFPNRPLKIEIHTEEKKEETELKTKEKEKEKKKSKKKGKKEKKEEKQEDKKTVLGTIKDKVLTPEVALVTTITVGKFLFTQYGTTMLAAMSTSFPILPVAALVFALCFAQETENALSIVETTTKAITNLGKLVDAIGKFTEAPELG